MLNSTSKRLVPFLVASGTIVGSAPALAVPPPTHVYELNFSFEDSLDGPSLTPNGAGTLSATGYTVPAHDSGLTLVGGLSAHTYSIEMRVRLDGFPEPSSCVSGDQICSAKIVDFTDRTEDHGFYTPTSDGDASDGRLQVCCTPAADSSEGTIVYGQSAHLLFTRDGGTKEVRGYTNGVLQWSAIDQFDNTAFDAPNSVAHFLMDDFAFVDDAPIGFIDRLVIYDKALSADDAACVANGCNVYSSVGQCLSSQIEANCNGLHGRDRVKCINEQRAYCRRLLVTRVHCH